jgi:bifunctional UDP-N-acetylglucosamine pyrophosphorylase/glucosamine-1-phosphate N-acetyltransferase
MECVILAAGEGKRMHPLTYTRPKVMLPIVNKPLLEWNLVNAKAAGISEFLFVVGYKSEIVRSYFGNGKKWNVDINYVNQGKALGTAHAISMAEAFVDDFVVLCGDTIFGARDIQKIWNKKSSMGLVTVENPYEYGLVKVQGKKVIRIFEKVEKPFSNVINAGIYHFDKSIFDVIKVTGKSKRGEYEITDSINMVSKESNFEGIMLNEWRDVVYPWNLLDANEELLKHFPGSKKTNEKNVTIKGTVFIGKNNKLLPGSYIEGPVIIGNNCKIGPNCYIRPFTSIGDSCHIGNACEVKNSIIMDNSNVPHQNYVGDSIIGRNCNFGAGTKVANLRLDKKNISVVLNGRTIDTKRRKLGTIIGDNVQTGINSMINIGTTIGDNVFIGPGAIVGGEIKPKTQIM